jgi:hypothetical protein
MGAIGWHTVSFGKACGRVRCVEDPLLSFTDEGDTATSSYLQVDEQPRSQIRSVMRNDRPAAWLPARG